ncbi:hypothetical protein C5F61_17495 [Photobacterium damselae subsp. damselae]|nr:hypothetical protein C5F61_17495 [Photobacterium damselae subsp. damselae]
MLDKYVALDREKIGKKQLKARGRCQNITNSQCSFKWIKYKNRTNKDYKVGAEGAINPKPTYGLVMISTHRFQLHYPATVLLPFLLFLLQHFLKITKKVASKQIPNRI